MLEFHLETHRSAADGLYVKRSPVALFITQALALDFLFRGCKLLDYLTSRSAVLKLLYMLSPLFRYGLLYPFSVCSCLSIFPYILLYFFPVCSSLTFFLNFFKKLIYFGPFFVILRGRGYFFFIPLTVVFVLLSVSS